jgi:hypothetical protein
MWTEKSFSKLSQKMRSSKEGGTLLYTYTQATSVRVSMMLAGFFVGQGLPTGLKNETTEAASSLELLRSPLAEPWFRRWQRSQEAFPYGSDVEDHPRIRQFVEQYMKNNFGLNVKETI